MGQVVNEDELFKIATLVVALLSVLASVSVAVMQIRAIKERRDNADETRSNLTELAKSVNGAKTAAEAAAKAAGYFEGQAPHSARGDQLSAQAHGASEEARSISAAAELEIAKKPNT
jgi:hypothetical protein